MLKLVYSAPDVTPSKKRMLRCALPSTISPTSTSPLREPSNLERLRARRPDLAAVVDGLIDRFMEDE